MCSQVSPIPQLWPASSWGPWAGRKGNVSSPLTLSTGVAGRSSLARYHGSSLDSDVEPTSRSWERSPHCQAPPRHCILWDTFNLSYPCLEALLGRVGSFENSCQAGPLGHSPLPHHCATVQLRLCILPWGRGSGHSFQL